MPALRDLLYLIAERQRSVASECERHAGTGTLNGGAATEERDDDHDEEKVLEPTRQDRENDVDAAGHDTADPGRRRRQKQAKHQDERRDAAIQQRVAHGLGNLTLRVDGLLGDVTSRFEAVEDVDVGEHRNERRTRPPVSCRSSRPVGCF